MVTGDGAYIKKKNRSIILEKIIEHGTISRADLSKITGLNKATISVQVADLLEEELLFESIQEHNVVGRRPIMLSLNHTVGYVLGIDLDYKEIHYTLANIEGTPVLSKTVILKTDDYDEIVSLLIKQIKKYQNKCTNSRYGMVSLIIGIHGTVNKDESIHFVPKYQWHNKNLKTDLIKKLDMEIRIENNANLSSYAEKVFIHHASENLLSIIFTSGIGAGIMNRSKMHRGYHGAAGEIGHMIVSLDGKPCKCGNNGCWELYASELSLLKDLSKLLALPKVTHEDVRNLLVQKNDITYKQIDKFISNISTGLNNVINFYNPETLVLNSKILKMYPNAIEKIESNLKSSVSQYPDIVLSELGNKACVMGACALAIQRFLKVPQLILRFSEQTHLLD